MRAVHLLRCEHTACGRHVTMLRNGAYKSGQSLLDCTYERDLTTCNSCTNALDNESQGRYVKMVERR